MIELYIGHRIPKVIGRIKIKVKGFLRPSIDGSRRFVPEAVLSVSFRIYVRARRNGTPPCWNKLILQLVSDFRSVDLVRPRTSQIGPV